MGRIGEIESGGRCLCLGHSGKVHIRGLTREKCIGFNSGESIGNYIVHTMDVANSGCKLRNVVKLASLSRGMSIGSRVQCVRKRFVVGEHMEWLTFEKMSDEEVSNFDGKLAGDSEAITWSKRVFCVVIPLVLNWTSTWANQTWGSVGQKGGSLMPTAVTVTGVTGAASLGVVVDSPTVSIVASSVVDIVAIASRRGHQCSVLPI